MREVVLADILEPNDKVDPALYTRRPIAQVHRPRRPYCSHQTGYVVPTHKVDDIVKAGIPMWFPGQPRPASILVGEAQRRTRLCNFRGQGMRVLADDSPSNTMDTQHSGGTRRHA